MLEIEFWSELHCPFAHVTAIRLRRALAELDLPMRVHWRCWPLELVNRRGTPFTAVEAERPVLAQLEPDAFKPWHRRDYPFTFIPAMAALKCAALQGSETEDRYDAALRYGFFRDGRNLSLVHELFDIAAGAGVDTQRLERDYWSGRGLAAVWEDWQASHDRAIQGSPHLFVAGSDANVHNPGVRTHQSAHGIVVIDADDPEFLTGWLKLAHEAVATAGR